MTICTLRRKKHMRTADVPNLLPYTPPFASPIIYLEYLLFLHFTHPSRYSYFLEGELYQNKMTEYGGGHNRPKSENSDTRTNLIVNYLPQNMTEKELYSMFVTIGPVESCRVMKDFKTGYSYGFGFVNYSKAEDASHAISTLNGLQVQNKRLKVSFARPSGDDIKETNLYVTNLPKNVTEQQLDVLFCKFGTIVQKNLLKDKVTGMPRGVAFVRFDRREEAMEAIQNMHGVVPEGGTEPLHVKIAEEHGKQKAAYYAGWQAGYTQSRACNFAYQNWMKRQNKMHAHS